MPAKMIHKKLSSSQIILFGFLMVILVGAGLLMLPAAAASGEGTPFLDCLFTSTSAVCVTGLIVHDTATHWSFFGQAVILLLIQIGGMGVITVAVAIAMASGKRITLMQRSTMQDAISAPQVGGIVRFTGFILKGIFLFELLGALALMTVFVPGKGFRGVWLAVFHSVSAFCNAGFDLMGTQAPFSSLTSFIQNPVVNVTVMLLIVIGGIGFLTWQDIRRNGLRFSRYRMQSKVVLSVTGVLILFPALYFFFGEYGGLPFSQRFWASLFQAVTPRTAGFNTSDLTRLSEVGRMVTILLMLVVLDENGQPVEAGGVPVEELPVANQTPHTLGAVLSEEQQNNLNALFGKVLGTDSTSYTKDSGVVEVLKDLQQILKDPLPVERESLGRLFASDEFKTLVKDTMEQQWMLTPEDLKEPDKIGKLYEKMEGQLTRLTELTFR